MINTKEPFGYFKPFEALKAQVITVPVEMSEAGISPASLATIAKEAGLETKSAHSLKQAIAEAANRLENNQNMQILFCGSLYMVGEVLGLNETPPT